MASDGSLKFDTKIDESGFKKGLNGLQSSGSKALKGITSATKIVGTALLGVGIAAAKVGMDFEEGMSRVGAVSGATGSEMKLLTQTAKDLGRTTVFSATEASQGMEYLAMAGFKTTEIIDAMPGVLNTAAAGNVELGRAADITSNVLSGFNMTADQSNRVADVLTKTFTSSNTSMETLGDTMKYVAPIANASGFSLEEMAAAAGVLGDAGIQGSQAGMTLRNTILRLADPPKEAADALAQLGVSAVDASGEMKPFPDIIRELDAATQGMTKAQKTAIISQIAGTQSAAGLMAILEQGGDTLEDFTKELENAAGTAEEVAAKQLDNLAGDIKLLQSALEGAGIAINENFSDALRGSVQFLTEYISQIAFVIETIEDFEQAVIAVSAILGNMFVEAIQEMAEVVPQVLTVIEVFLTTFLGGLARAKGPLIDAAVSIILDMLSMYAEVIPAFLDTGVQLLSEFMSGIAMASPDLFALLQELLLSLLDVFSENLLTFAESGMFMIEMIVEGIIETIPVLLEVVSEMLEMLIETFALELPRLIETGILLITALLEGLSEAIPMLLLAGLEILLALVESITENIPLIIESALSIMETFMSTIIEMLPQLLEIALELITTLAEGISSSIDLLVDAAITIIESLSNFLIDNLPMILDAALEIIMAVFDGLVKNVDKLVDAAVTIIDSLVEFVLNNLPQVIDAALQIMLAIMNGLLDNLDLIIDASMTIMIALVEAIITMLPSIVNAAIQIIISLVNGLLNNMPQVVAAIVQIITSLIGAVLRMLPQILALGIQLIGELAIGIAKTAATVVNAGLNVIKSVFAAMKGALSGAAQIGTDLVKGIWNGINDVTGWILGKIKGFGSSVMKGIKGIFGIKSPSTLMRDEVGENLVLGIGVGFEGKAPKVQEEMQDELDGLTSKLTSAVEMENTLAFEGARSDHAARRISGTEDHSDNSDNSTLITGNTFEIREEADIDKVAEKLDKLRKRRKRR